jgi:hypothetical protein
LSGNNGNGDAVSGGEGFDAGLIKPDANRQDGIESEKGLPPQAASRAVNEYSGRPG